MRTSTRVALNFSLGIACLAGLFVLYVYRVVLGDPLYALLLAVVAGAAFLYIQRGLFVRSEEVIEKLARVPSIQALAEEAQSKALQINDLQEELQRLQTVVQVSAQRLYLQKRLEVLEQELKQRYHALEVVHEEMDALGHPVASSLTLEEIGRIEQTIGLREKGYLVLRLGRRRIPIPSSVLDLYPFGLGHAVYGYLQRRKHRQPTERQGAK